MIWKPYSERAKRRSHDFEVRYRFFSAEEGGRQTGLPHQGYRCDFTYDGDDRDENGAWMIWPEFEDAQKNVILEENRSVPAEGTARMRIVSEEMRGHHLARLKIGSKGYLVEGSRRVAVCEVIAINELMQG